MKPLRGLSTLFLIIFFAAGCGKNAPPKTDRPVQTRFETTVPDSAIDLSQADRPMPPKQSSIIETADWFDTTRSLFALSEAEPTLSSMAKEISERFYKQPGASTALTGTTTPMGNPFVAQAFEVFGGFAEDSLKKMLSLGRSRVSYALSKTEFHMYERQKGDRPSPDRALDVAINGLKDFNKVLKEGSDPSLRALTCRITAKIDRDFVRLMERIKPDIVPKTPLEQSSIYIMRLMKTIEKLEFLPEEVRRDLDRNLKLALVVGRYADLMKTPDSALKVIIDAWTNREAKMEFPKQVRDILLSYTDDQLLAIATENEPRILSDSEYAEVEKDREQLRRIFLSSSEVLLMARGKLGFRGSKSKLEKEIVGLMIRAWQNIEIRKYFVPSLKATLSKFDYQGLMNIRNNSYPALVLQAASEVFTKLDWGDSSSGYLPHWDLDSMNTKDLTVQAVTRREMLVRLEKFNDPLPDKSIKAVGLTRLQIFLNGAVNEAVQTSLEKQVLGFVPEIKRLMKKEIDKNLKKAGETSTDLISTEYSRLARFYLGKEVFGVAELKNDDDCTELVSDEKPKDHSFDENEILGKKQIPFIEAAQVARRNDGVAPFSSQVQTSAAAFALGLTNTIDQLENGGFAQDSVALQFRAICKLATLMGYKDMDGRSVEPLLVPLREQTPFQVAEYDPRKGMRALPDRLKIKSHYRIDEPAADSSSRRASVVGQVELLRALTRMMRYLKPWASQSDFDLGLGAFRMREVPDRQLFSRATFFKESMGLATTILKNWNTWAVGVTSSDGRFFWLQQLNGNSQVVKASATLHDLNSKGANYVVTARDVALSLIGVNEFVEMLDEAASVQDKELKSLIAQVLEFRANLETLEVGLAMTAMMRLSRPDGGFYSAFDFGVMKAVEGPADLEDQLLLQEALMAAGKRMQRDFWIRRAVENYFFLNTKMWNSSIGFYFSTESQRDGTVSLKNMVRLVRNLDALAPYIQVLNTSSFNQLKALRSAVFARVSQAKPQVLKSKTLQFSP